MEFYKFSGSGNDFIIINNMNGALDGSDWSALARQLCRRRISVGADGLIAVEPSSHADFQWLFFNADGSSADMCGNGGRCVARFAQMMGIAGERMTFETGAGIIAAELTGEDIVKIRLTPSHSFQENIVVPLGDGEITVSFINTGVPHVVCLVDTVSNCDVVGWGRVLRYHERFAPAGANANFISVEEGLIRLRTYERGVEDETLACGTGAVAAAVVAIRRGLVVSPVRVQVRSGEVLRVHYQSDAEGEQIHLEGGAVFVYRGETAAGALF